MEDQIDIEQLLAAGHTIQVKPEGYSMYPLLVPGRDMVIIAPFQAHAAENAVPYGRASGIRRGEVVLYRRKQGILVLHRVYRAKKEGLYMVGDNQTQVEGPLGYEQVRGKMVGFIRNGKRRSVRNPLYRIYSRVWLFLRPVRHRLAIWVHAIRRKVAGKNGTADK